ncbi:LysR family transcriptional regulator [Palleronia abyssalis]|uniref:HTH-type transcriptional regulator GbpR n=1 Tax=Palleronia abyssalis TaxID=1501240 RepID=A0A2R8BR97_9RHOB|nr:LysR family transcriptional regulator [Palleronia abyssalis]SPJ22658.1 HTH-type transcriptional regulator GbpR [Palleronia abyssalis]
MSSEIPKGNELVRRGLKFSQLRLLAALRETGQIGAAAAHVGMTQPAASRLLSQLEAMIGTPLYARHSRGIALTEAGSVLADQAMTTLRGLDQAAEKMAQLRGGTRGHVRIGSVTGPSLELLLPVLREARLAFPEVEVTVRVETSDRLAEALLADDLDFYIGRIPDGADARPFAIDMIGAEPISLLVRLDHPLVNRQNITLEECLSYDWVMQPPGGLLRRTAETYLLERGHALPRRVIGTTSILFTLALINETNAVAPLARAVAQFFIERAALGSRLEVLPAAMDMAVKDFGLVRRADDDPRPVTDRILNLLRAHAAKRGQQTG